MVDFGERSHYKLKKKAARHDGKSEAKCSGGFFLGRCWRMGKAIAGNVEKVFGRPRSS